MKIQILLKSSSLRIKISTIFLLSLAYIPLEIFFTAPIQAKNNSNPIQEVHLKLTDRDRKQMIAQTDPNASLGTKLGIDELMSILKISQPTQSPAIRKVILTFPSDTPAEMKTDFPGIVATREFHLIVINDNTIREKARRNPHVEGLEGNLPNGGSISVRIVERAPSSTRSSAIMKIKNHGISGFEQVNQIDFVVQ
jgi:hypothetical protein